MSFIKQLEIQQYYNLLKNTIVENFDDLKSDANLKMKEQEFSKLKKQVEELSSQSDCDHK